MKTKMIRLILFTLLMCVFTGAMAQDHITVKGSVIDKRSKDRIPYANISVKGKSIGTVSNSTGEFESHIPSEFAADSMYVSHIGYKTLKFNVGWLSKNRMDQFALEEDAVLLGEIVVSSDMGKVKVEQALKAIQNNYPTQPYLMD
ncbi:MAG: carboxypeptidase-like regulatory domain-containing protein, partial [Flammeovirgaceae bacterium]